MILFNVLYKEYQQTGVPPGDAESFVFAHMWKDVLENSIYPRYVTDGTINDLGFFSYVDDIPDGFTLLSEKPLSVNEFVNAFYQQLQKSVRNGTVKVTNTTPPYFLPSRWIDDFDPDKYLNRRDAAKVLRRLLYDRE